MVVLRNPFYSVLALVGHLVSLAVLFLLLRAEFVAAVQVVVYAGAVMVLYVFVVAYVGGEGESIGERLRGAPDRSAARPAPRRRGARRRAARRAADRAARHRAWRRSTATAPATRPGRATFGTPAYIGKLLLTRFLLAFEVASFLLLIAAVGGVVLARRRGGLGEERRPRDAAACTPLRRCRAPAAATRHDRAERASARSGA